MAETVIFAEQTLEFSVQSGIASLEIVPAPFILVEGENYRVVLDGISYELTCEIADGLPELRFIEIDENDEPANGTFQIIYGSQEVTGADGGVVGIVVIDTTGAENHTVAVYQVTAEESGIIVKDRDGNDVIHKGAYGIRARTTDGNTKVFVDADTLDKPVETSVELDFSSGDMEVLPGDGEVFSEVNIPKPVNLIPENIAEGVDIAGIIGALSGGSGSASVTYGTFKGNGGNTVVNHNLGVIPDLIFVRSGVGNFPTVKKVLYFAVAVSDAFRSLTGIDRRQCASGYSSTSGISAYNWDVSITGGTGIVFNTNIDSFTVGHSAGNLITNSNDNYNWVAIAGLT